jgi:hypothetical protein
VLFGIFAGTVALWLALMPQKPWQRAAAALVMGATISGMHYVGMASTVFQADPLAQLADGVPGDAIAIAVTLTTLALMLCVIVTVVADRRLMATEMRNAEILRQSNAELARANAELRHGRQQFDAALSNMSHGLTVVSPVPASTTCTGCLRIRHDLERRYRTCWTC